MPQRIEVPGMGIVEFPDGMDDAAISAAIQKNQPTANKPDTAGGVAADVAKSAGVGVANAAIGMAGIPGDLQGIGRAAGDLIGSKMPSMPEAPQWLSDLWKRGQISPERAEHYMRRGDMPTAPLPASGDIRSAVEGVTGPMYKPKTMAGEYARTVGEFAPAVVGGAPGMIGKAAQVAVPAVASETAGQLTKGTDAEPYARLAAALAGGVATIPRNPVQRVTPDELRDAARRAYRDPEVTGLRFGPNAGNQLADDVAIAMRQQGARPVNAQEAFSISDELRGAATIEDFKSTRTALNEAVRSGTDPLTGRLNTGANAARVGTQRISNYLDNIPAGDVQTGNPANASRLLNEASQNYGAAKRSEMVEGLVRRAEINAATANSGQNVNNATRQQLKRLLQDTRKQGGFTDDELQQLERATLGTRTGNAARFVGNALGPSGAMALQNTAAAGVLGGAVAYGTGNDPTTAALATALLSQGVGRGARALGNASQARQTRQFQDMIVARSPLGQAVMPQLNAQRMQQLNQADREALIRALLGSQVLPRTQGYQPVQ